jgi:KDO2-lipid IV(A) lauroyltransferase
MAEHKRSKVLDWLVYLAVRLLVCLVQALSPESGESLARLLGWLVHRVNRRHRQVAMENLRVAFPDRYSDSERQRMVLKVYEHFCTMLIEIMHMPRRYHLHNYKRWTKVVHTDRFVEVLLSGRPVLFVTAHLGNWEMGGYALGLFGFQSHAIARPLDNPYLDNYLRSFRERTGQKLLAKHGDFEQINQVLEQGGVLATLADQDAGQRGLFVNFFGRPASTHKAVALMALQHDVVMIVAGTAKFDGSYSVIPMDIIDPRDYQQAPDAVHALTQRFTTGLEELIRLAPEQYFWVHRRWKHQPKERARAKAG